MDYFVVKKNEILNNLNKFAIFINNNGDRLLGLIIDEQHIYEALGHSKFDKIPKVVPPDYKKITRTKNKFSDGWMLDLYFQKYVSPEKILKLKESGCEYQEWYEKSRQYWLNFKTLLDIENGGEINCLLLDRNVCDVIYSHNEIGKLYDPKIFFEKNIVTIKKIKDVFVKIKFPWQNELKEFELEVQYKKDSWYPLINGSLPAKCVQMNYNLLDKKYKWHELPEDICVGFRGPMIMYNDLDFLPSIYIL